MRNRMLGRVIGFATRRGDVLSLAWWAIYYNEVIRALGQNPPLTHPLRCLLWTSDVCNQAMATANLTFPGLSSAGDVAVIRRAGAGTRCDLPQRQHRAISADARGEPRLFVAKLEPFYAWTRDRRGRWSASRWSAPCWCTAWARCSIRTVWLSPRAAGGAPGGTVGAVRQRRWSMLGLFTVCRADLDPVFSHRVLQMLQGEVGKAGGGWLNATRRMIFFATAPAAEEPCGQSPLRAI